MGPSDLNTAAQARAAALAVFEARLLVERLCQPTNLNIDAALNRLEMSFYARAAELDKPKRAKGKRK